MAYLTPPSGRRISAGPANLACFAAMAMWACGFPAAEVLLADWGVLALISSRMAIAGVILMAIWALVDGMAAIRQAPWRPGLLIGGVGFGVGAALLLLGQEMSDPVTTAIAVTTTPIFGAALEIVFDRRRPTALLLCGIALALIGGVIATGASLGEGSFGLGAAICLLSVAVYSWGGRATARRLSELSAIGQAAVTTVGAAVICGGAFLCGALFADDSARLGQIDLNTAALFLIYTLFGYILSQTLWLWSVGRMGILLASIHMNAMPFYVMLAGVFALGAEWSERQAMGAALVALGVLVAQARPSARNL